MEKPNKRRRAVWIVLVIVLVLVVGIGALAMWQKNNIEAVVQYTQYSKEELETKLVENDKEVEQVLEEAISNAQKVDAEAKPMEPPKPVEPEPAEPAVPEAPQPAEPVPEAPREPTYEEQLKALVDRVYALRDEYVQALENMEQEAVETYRALPPEKRTKKGKIEFASGYITKATELERECDGKMDVYYSADWRDAPDYGISKDWFEKIYSWEGVVDFKVEFDYLEATFANFDLKITAYLADGTKKTARGGNMY